VHAVDCVNVRSEYLYRDEKHAKLMELVESAFNYSSCPAQQFSYLSIFNVVLL
jgi:hypothetical protein